MASKEIIFFVVIYNVAFLVGFIVDGENARLYQAVFLSIIFIGYMIESMIIYMFNRLINRDCFSQIIRVLPKISLGFCVVYSLLLIFSFEWSAEPEHYALLIFIFYVGGLARMAVHKAMLKWLLLRPSVRSN